MSTHGIALTGLDAHVVRVSVAATPGPARFEIVGLAEASVREARVRVRASLQQIGVDLRGHAVTVTLEPVDLRKTGGALDLAIAIAVLEALGSLPAEAFDGAVFLGELSLSGSVRPVRGVLPALRGAARLGFRRAIVARDNAPEASLVREMAVRVVDNLAGILASDGALDLASAQPEYAPTFGAANVDLADIRGMKSAKRALEVAAAGQHHILLVGPPGAGKTMLARRLPTIMVPMTEPESLDVTAVHSVAGLLAADRGVITSRPFRAPHHTVSAAGLVGGGDPMRPGEVSLAHEGVLFLDELPEFRAAALDTLREPMRDGRVTLVRGQVRTTFPAKALIVGATNECPCGFARSPRCTCPPERIVAYQRRVPPWFDVNVVVQPLEPRSLTAPPAGEASAGIRERVSAARARAVDRQRCPNGELSEEAIARCATPDTAGAQLVTDAFNDRTAVARALRVARTIADLDGSQLVLERHVAEAVSLRAVDRRHQ